MHIHISIFIIMTLFVAINHLYKDDIKKAFFIILIGIMASIGGFVIYKFLLFITNSPSVGRDKFVFFNDDVFTILKHNTQAVYDLICLVFNYHYLIGFCFTILAFLYGIYKLLKKQLKASNKVLIILFLLLIPILIPLPLIVLENTYVNPRVMIGFSFIIYAMLFLVSKYSQKLTTYISLYFVIISFPLMGSFANLLKDQDQFQTTIVYDVMSKTDLNGKYLIVDGQVPWSSQSENLIYGYDFINYLHIKFLGNQNFGLEEFFVLKSNNLYNISFLKDKRREEVLNNKMNIPIINRTSFYNLRADGKHVIIDFNKIDIFIPELINIELKPSENVTGNFDIVTNDKEIYSIKGWAIIFGANSIKDNVKLLLIGGSKIYVSELSKEKRLDVSEAMNGQYNDSGFSGKINTNTMDKGVYKLGLIIENENEKKILIKDNKITVK
ncbi:glucosyltransferase domain-containing protein [Empedobacter falsenii]